MGERPAFVAQAANGLQRDALAWAVLLTTLVIVGATWQNNLITGLSACFGILLFAVTLSLSRTRKRAVSLARQMTQELRAKSEELQAIYDHSPVGILEISADGKTSQFNRRCEEIVSLSAKDAQDRGWTRRIHPLDKDSVTEAFRSALMYATEFDSEHRLLLDDGSIRWVHVKMAPIHENGQLARMVGFVEDISRRKEAAFAIDRSEKFLNSVLNTMPHPVWVKDEQHRWVLVNDAFCSRLNMSREALLGRTDGDVYDADQAERSWREDDEALKSEQPLMNDEQVRSDSGDTVWWQKTKYAFSLSDGARYVAGFAINITDLKQAEETIKESEARFRSLTQLSSDWFWEQDENYRFTYLSSGVIRRGIAPEMHLGKTRWEVSLAPVDDPGWRRHRETLEARRPYYNLRFRVPSVTGEPRLVSVNGEPVFDPSGRFKGYRGVARDLTDVTRAESAIRDREARLQAVFETVTDGMVVIDEKGIIQSVNPAISRIFDLSSRELLGANVTLLMPERYRHAHEEGLRNYRGRDQSQVIGQLMRLSGRRRDGSEFPIEITISEMAIGEQRFFAATIRDIAKTIKAEEEIRRHRDHLEELVEEKTREAVAAMEAAEKANRTKSEFLANMSHELRTPMHAILSFARLGVDRAGSRDGDWDRVHRYFRRIDESGHRLLTLLNGLLDLSKLEAGAMRYDFSLHDVVLLVRKVVADFDALAKQHGVSISSEFSKPILDAWCDPDRICQVIQNLIANALKFTPKGKAITVRVAESNPAEQRRATDLGVVEAVDVVVIDEGIGIPDGELDLVFDKFVQSSKTKSSAGGTGLGLAICREIVLDHGGHIFASHNPKGGAIFTFTLRKAPLPGFGSASSQSVAVKEVYL